MTCINNDCLERKEAGLMHELAVICPGLCSFSLDHEKVQDMEWRLSCNTTEKQRSENPTHLSPWRVAQNETEINGNPAALSRLV